MNSLLNTNFVKYGLPFFVLIIGGSFGLAEFSKVRYEHRKQVKLTPKEAKALGVEMKAPGEVTLEKEFEKLEKEDITNWVNKRGPRPWEQQ